MFWGDKTPRDHIPRLCPLSQRGGGGGGHEGEAGIFCLTEGKNVFDLCLRMSLQLFILVLKTSQQLVMCVQR